MKKIILILFAVLNGLNAAAQPAFKEPLNELSQTQKADRNLALTGDYNAMRNIAFSYVSSMTGGAKSKIGGCAWYLLIPAVHKLKFHVGDIGNISVNCNSLNPTDLDVAYVYAFRTLASSKN